MEQQRRNDQDRLKQLQQDQRVKPPEAAQSHQPPPPQKCPRCDSSNTKFCYYNNYSLSQPRYFCKSCRRYWTHGGTLRNVPVGGGCRKSKRPKPSAPSASGGDIGRSTQPLSPSFPSQNMSSGQPMRPLPPIMGNTFYGGGGSFLSSLAAMQSLSTGINQGATLNLGGGGGGGQFDANMALMQGATLQPLKSQLPPPSPSQFQLQNDQYFQSQQNLSLPPRPSLTSWTQNFINRGPPANTSTSAASSSFWSAAAAGGGENLAGSSFNPNHWQDSSNQGFDPSSDQ